MLTIKDKSSYKGNRKAVTQYIIDIVNQIDPSGINGQIQKVELDGLSDASFVAHMKRLKNGEDFIRFYFPNGGKANTSFDINKNVAKKNFGYDFEQHLMIGSDDPDTPTYMSPNKYIVMHPVMRRQAQTMESGISVAEHSNSIDQRTGAVTGVSAASKCSGPEIGVLRSNGMFDTLIELVSLRGGDEGAARSMNAQFMQTGHASIAESKRSATGVGAIHAQYVMLMGMHLSNTLAQN